MSDAPRDPWLLLAQRTQARIAIGRVGASLPTREVLSFALAHAQARDAVHARVDWARLITSIEALGLRAVSVTSQAAERSVYLRRPDLGRKLEVASTQRLSAATDGAVCDLALVVGDGLSATAIDVQAAVLLTALVPLMVRRGLKFGPVVLAEGARVALGDEIGALLGARCVLVLIGERPGLSSADSLGAYLTYEPRPGRTDAERNCVSNIRSEGFAPVAAAQNIAWLIEAALEARTTGVRLKDHSDSRLQVNRAVGEAIEDE